MKYLFHLVLILCYLDQALPALTITYSNKNYANLQSAVDALRASTDSQKILYLPSGNYTDVLNVSDNLTIESNCTMDTMMSGNGKADARITVNGNVFVNLRKVFFLNATQGVNFRGFSQGNINNCIFSMGNANTAIVGEPTTSVNIFNNTFYKNKVAVQANIITSIQNNIFSLSGNSLVSLNSSNSITHNLFMEENEGNIFGSANIRGDASFVSANTLDFHLKVGSLAINAGNVLEGMDVLDSTMPDIGAYGGPYSDTMPQDIRSLTITSTSLSASLLDLTLKWDSNLDYQIKGYYLYYDTDQAGIPYAGNVSGLEASPHDAGLVATDVGLMSTTNLKPINIAVSSMGSPIISSIVPRNQSIVVNWTSADNATGYLLQYRVSGSSGAYSDMEVGLVNTATITGLINGVVYEVRVSGLSRPTIYFAVAAYYSKDLSLNRVGALNTAKASYQATVAAIGNPSSSTTATPEMTLGFPQLPNNGGGCLLKGNVQ